MMRRIVPAFSLWLLVVGSSVASATPPSDPATIDDARSRLAAVDAQKLDADAVVVLEDVRVQVRSSGIGETTTRRLVKILREPALRPECVQRFEYDPTTNRHTIQAVRVYRADGRIDEIDPASAAEQPAPQWGIYWGSRQRCIEIPRLDVGDAIETLETKIGFNVAYLRGGTTGEAGSGEGAGGTAASGTQAKGASTPAAADDADELVPPMPGHWYDEVAFWSDRPVLEKRYTARLPRDKPLQYGVYNGALTSSVTFDGDHVVYRFEKRDIAPLASEPGMVSPGDVACKLVLATLGEWREKSRWFHAANEHAFAVDDAIRAKVVEATRDCPDDEAKVTALNHWVAENIRYVGTTRGCREGYTTHDAIETFRDRGGVCKDKAGLLVAMLRAAGFESYIVMTMAGQEVWPVPADQFNHAVACVRGRDGALQLLDPTWMPKSRDNWSTFESLQHVVYGTPEGLPLERSPYCPPERNHVAWTAETEVLDSGVLTSRIAVVATGGPETSLRRAFAARPPHDRDRTLDDALARLAPNVVRESFTIMDPVDFSGPYKVDVQVRAEHLAAGDREVRCVPLPALRSILCDGALGDVLASVAPDTRKYTMRLRTTRRAIYDETIRLPRGWTVASHPKAVSLDGPAASLEFAVEPSASELRYRCALTIKKHRIEPDEYRQYKQVVDAFQQLAGDYLVCRTESPRAMR